MTRTHQALLLLIFLTSFATSSYGADSPASGPSETRDPTIQADVEALRFSIQELFPERTATIEQVEPGGGWQRADLQEGFQDVLLARQNPDGTLSVTCVDHLEPAVEFLSKPAKPVVEDR